MMHFMQKNKRETSCSERNETTNKTEKCKRKSLYATGMCKIEKTKRTWGIFWHSVNILHRVTLGNSDDMDKKCKQKKFTGTSFV